MKNTLLVIAVLFAGACATKPVRELTLREKVVGTYGLKKDEDTIRPVFLENGVREGYANGKKWEEGKWSAVGEEIHADAGDGVTSVLSVNKGGSISIIAEIYKDGKRQDAPKIEQVTLKRIK
mgnify:CR=1 FL=1